MNPEPDPVEDPEKREPLEASVVSIVTTDGMTWLATRTIASDCVRVICWATADWPVAVVTGVAGFAVSEKATYVPTADRTADSRATATMMGPRRRAAPSRLGTPWSDRPKAGAAAHGW
jgi:hypothetical protein